MKSLKNNSAKDIESEGNLNTPKHKKRKKKADGDDTEDNLKIDV